MNINKFKPKNILRGVIFLVYLWSFLIGGAICVVGQLLIDFTKLTPARILVCFVVLGVFLEAIGVYGKLVEFAGAGATVPLTGFGFLIANGIEKAVLESGFLGVFTGGLVATAGGITAAIVISFLISLVCRSKSQ